MNLWYILYCCDGQLLWSLRERDTKAAQEQTQSIHTTSYTGSHSPGSEIVREKMSNGYYQAGKTWTTNECAALGTKVFHQQRDSRNVMLKGLPM